MKSKHYPKNWGQINLKMYIDILKVSDEDFENENDRLVKIMSVLTGMSTEEIYDMEISDYGKLQNKMSFIEREPSIDDVDSFWIKGVQYKDNTLMNEITTGEFIDLNGLTNDHDKIFDNFPTLLAIFYRPLDEDGNITPYVSDDVMDRKELFMEHLSAVEIWNALGRYLKKKSIYLIHISQFSSRKMKKNRQRQTR